jgi:hypothetical protein
MKFRTPQEIVGCIQRFMDGTCGRESKERSPWLGAIIQLSLFCHWVLWAWC